VDVEKIIVVFMNTVSLRITSIFIFSTLFTSCSIKKNADLSKWIGVYRYEEMPVETNAGYSMVMDWSLMITDTINLTHGVLEVNGQQTFIKLEIDVKGTSDSIAIIHKKFIAGSGEKLKAGDTLFMLTNNNGNIFTRWKLMEPRLNDLQTKECKCFDKIINNK
jgi:hypothetical protein